jgi:hypothetical protein
MPLRVFQPNTRGTLYAVHGIWLSCHGAVTGGKVQRVFGERFVSSKRRLRRKSCGTKIRYATIEEAQKMARGNIVAYWCAFCGGCHIGHKKGSTADALRNITGRHT